MEPSAQQPRQCGVQGSATFLICMLAVLLFCVAANLLAQTEADWDWVRKNYARALDDLLPIQRSSGKYVAYRSIHYAVPGDLEYSFLIGYDWKQAGPGLMDFLSAHVRVADTDPIYYQMMKLHRANSRADAASVEQQIRINTWDTTENSCSAVRKKFDEFTRIRFGPPDFHLLILDPLTHVFHIQTTDGDMNLELVDPKAPLVVWALATRNALEVCAGTAPQ